MIATDRLKQLETFRRVVELGSFSGAARALGVGQPAVSKQIRGLEERLGARLVERTTHELSITLAGRLLYEQCTVLLDGLDSLEDEIAASARGVQGRLTMHAPLALGERVLTRELVAFQEKYPRVSLDVRYEDRVADLVAEKVDVAFRVGPLAQDDLIARKLALVPRVCVATPKYLARAGVAAGPAELEQHNLVYYRGLAAGDRLVFTRGEQSATVTLRGRFVVNFTTALVELALAHVGIAIVPHWRVMEELQRRSLILVLSDWALPPTPLHVVYPSATLKTKRVEKLVEFLSSRIAGLPGFDPLAARATRDR
jgi:DNA-binding transcriptional LysR family regulator